MDVPEKAIAAITITNPPITPPTIILGFNIFFLGLLVLSVNIKNPYTTIIQNIHAVLSGCPRRKNSSQQGSNETI